MAADKVAEFELKDDTVSSSKSKESVPSSDPDKKTNALHEALVASKRNLFEWLETVETRYTICTETDFNEGEVERAVWKRTAKHLLDWIECLDRRYRYPQNAESISCDIANLSVDAQNAAKLVKQQHERQAKLARLMADLQSENNRMYKKFCHYSDTLRNALRDVQGERWSKAWPVAIQHGEKCKKCLQIIANKAGQLKSVSEAWLKDQEEALSTTSVPTQASKVPEVVEVSSDDDA